VDVVQELTKDLLSTGVTDSGRITLVVAPPRNKKNALALAKRIKKARLRADFSRDELADVMKVHRNTIANWESPSEPTFPGRYLSRLAKVLNVEEVWLLHGDEVIQDAEIGEVLVRLQKTNERTNQLLEAIAGALQERGLLQEPQQEPH
jgi:transcriptional regulator with XRE-family HTH domain